MTEDRKRLLISIVTALVLHLAVLILTGLNSFDYEVPKEFGPLRVELTPPEAAVIQEPEIPEKKPVEEIAPETVPEAAAPAPAAEAAEVSEPVAVPAPSLPAAAVKPAEPRPEPASYTRAEPDADFLADIKSRTGGSEGGELSNLFGDDPVPATTNNPDALAASGSHTGSVVVRSDQEVAREEDYTRSVRNNPVSEEVAVLDDDVLNSLDNSLSAGNSASAAAASGTAVSAVSSPIGRTDSTGSSPLITFESAAASRALTNWDHPEIPDEIGEEGARKYTVIIDFLVDADGFTSGFKLRKPSGKADIDAAVQKALRGWVFEEAGSGSGRKKVPATLTYVIEIK